jgi:mono/diheme cytochrome c family protein
MNFWISIRMTIPLVSVSALFMLQPSHAASASSQDANVSKTQVATPQSALAKSAPPTAPRTNSTLAYENVNVESGKQNVLRYGCPVCHGRDLKGGMANSNAQGGVVLPLIHLPDDYTKDEVIAIIRNGKKPPLQDPKGLVPPIYMPAWSRIVNDVHIKSAVEYLWTQRQKSEKENW